jgi:hypothetical protein
MYSLIRFFFALFYRETGEGLVLVFEDNGMGIPDDMKENIFERRYEEKRGHGTFPCTRNSFHHRNHNQRNGSASKRYQVRNHRSEGSTPVYGHVMTGKVTERQKVVFSVSCSMTAGVVYNFLPALRSA